MLPGCRGVRVLCTSPIYERTLEGNFVKRHPFKVETQSYCLPNEVSLQFTFGHHNGRRPDHHIYIAEGPPVTLSPMISLWPLPPVTRRTCLGYVVVTYQPLFRTTVDLLLSTKGRWFALLEAVCSTTGFTLSLKSFRLMNQSIKRMTGLSRLRKKSYGNLGLKVLYKREWNLPVVT